MLAASLLAIGFPVRPWRACPRCPRASRSAWWPRCRPCSIPARWRRRPTARCSSPRTRWTRSARPTKPIDRILLFRDGKEPVVFAEKLNAIFGMVWHDGALYVMNMPHLTVFRDKRRRRQGRPAQGALHGPGRSRRHAQRLQRPHRLGPPDRHRRLPLHLGRRQGGAQGDRARRPNGPDRGRRHAPLPARRHRAGGLSRRARATTSSPTSTTATTCSPMTTPTTARAGGPGSRITSTAAITAIRTTITTGPTGCCPGWPSTAAARLAAACSTTRTSGPRSTAACLFWAEWGKREVRAFRFEPTARPSRSPRRSTSSSRARSTNFRPLDLASRTTARRMYIADWSMGGWGNKTEKLGRVYAVTYDGAEGQDSTARQGLRPDRGPDPAARPSLVQRADAGPDGVDRPGQERACGR